MVTKDKAITEARGAVGKRLTTVKGYTNPYGAQCLAFIAWYLDMIGYAKAIMPGYNAIDVWTQNPLGLQRVAPQDIKPGDIFFAKYSSGGVEFGHTGADVEDRGAVFLSVDQNYYKASLSDGSPAAFVVHRKSEIIGALRPAFGSKEEEVFNGQGAKAWYEAYERSLKEIDMLRGINNWREQRLTQLAVALGDDADAVEQDDVDRMLARVDGLVKSDAAKSQDVPARTRETLVKLRDGLSALLDQTK